jgi:hypothetical protein
LTPLFDLERYSRLPGDIQQIIDHGLDERNPFFASDRLGFALRVARDQGS